MRIKYSILLQSSEYGVNEYLLLIPVHFRAFGVYSGMTVYNGKFDVTIKVYFVLRIDLPLF